MQEIKIGKREIPLFYSTYEMLAIQEEIGCTAFQLREEVFGIRQEDEDDPMSIRMECVTDPEKTKKLGTLIRILGNAGLEENGEKGDLTDKWILRNMKPALIMAYAVAAMAETPKLTEGFWRNRTQKNSQGTDIPAGGFLWADRRTEKRRN